MPDFQGEGLASEYNRTLDATCKSGPRFRMYEQLRTEDSILRFETKPESNDDGSDVDIRKIVGNPDVLTDPNVAALTRQCSKTLGGNDCQRAAAPPLSTRLQRQPKVRRNDAFMEGHLVTTPFPEHSARELCERSTSPGPDMVSMCEGLYCDMSERKVWDICSENKRNVVLIPR